MQKVFISLQKCNFIKGLAILAVILVHVLSYLPGIYTGPQQFFFISLDQLTRFCLPAFFILSGYGLASKYTQQQINYFKFLKERVAKLLPLYLIWSLVSILVIKSVPIWSFGNQPASIVLQLLFGQTDYQLYFLPVLLQLYVLFPLIWFFRKKINLVFIIAVLIQSALYLFFTFHSSNSDRFEYALGISWVTYFVFGIFLKLKTLPQLLLKLSLPLSFGLFCFMVLSSLQQINAGMNPLPALKFTRLIIIPFGLLSNLSLINLRLPKFWLKKNDKQKKLFDILIWLGKNSYIIFLSHTIGLRIVYAFLTNQIEMRALFLVTLAWLVTVCVSYKLLRAKKSKAIISM